MIQQSLKNVPRPALVLGLSGAIPFVGLALLAIFGSSWAQFGLLAYGTAILSFMGGIHWGLAMAQDSNSFERLGISVVPALIAWLGLWIGGSLGFLMLAIAFGGLLAYDLRMVAHNQAPAWYPDLRRPLTLIVILSVVAGAMGG